MRRSGTFVSSFAETIRRVSGGSKKLVPDVLPGENDATLFLSYNLTKLNKGEGYYYSLRVRFRGSNGN